MTKILIGLAALAATLTGVSSWASPARIDWPSRHSEVVCGGSSESEDLNVTISSPDGLLSADSKDGRLTIFIDLRTPGRAKWVIGEFWTDADYAAREKILQKLSPDEAALMRQLSTKRISEIYTGFTHGFVHLQTTFGNRTLSLSCQETPKPATD